MQLDMLPPDLAGQVQELQNYEFTSSARRASSSSELIDKLRQQLMQSYFNQMAGAMQNVIPEHMQRMKDMLAELNQMLEQRERGRGHAADFERVHGALRRLLPREPAEPRRAARGRWPSAWRPCRRCSTR